jgi:uncharacterized protein (TIGR02646 family)
MLRVARANVAAPPVLVVKDGLGDKERKRAEKYFAQLAKGLRPAKKIDFAVYKQPEVRAALVALFGNKCAYCESDYTAVHPVDVEHWRPKGAVITADGTELPLGYHWLASSWENLLPSCIDCNRERGQHTLPQGRTVKSGKAERFPLADETKRASKPADVAGESPLLLNPCDDEPDDHLEYFDADPERALMRERASSRKGRTSIDIYGLNRDGLVRARHRHLNDVEIALSRLRRDIGFLDRDDLPATLRPALEDSVSESLKQLQAYRRPHGLYCALVRARVDPELRALGLPLE